MIHGKGKKMALFGFDRSSNHAAYPEDALWASVLLVGDNSSAKVRPAPLRPGWYYKTAQEKEEGKRTVQNMNGADGQRFGMETILKERGLLKGGRLSGGCKQCKKEKERGDEDRYKICHRANCCMRKIISLQPDFVAQKTRLEEVTCMFHFFFLIFCNLIFPFFCAVSIAQLAESRGHRVIFFPRYHCELNMIEMYWGKAKRLPRLFFFFVFLTANLTDCCGAEI